jgi:hypothetical protein
MFADLLRCSRLCFFLSDTPKDNGQTKKKDHATQEKKKRQRKKKSASPKKNNPTRHHHRRRQTTQSPPTPFTSDNQQEAGPTSVANPPHILNQVLPVLEKQHDTSCLPPLVKTIKKKLVKTIHKNKKPLSSVSTALGKFVQSLLKEVLEKNVIKNIASLK